MMTAPDDIIIPVDAPFGVKRELARGCTFFLGLVATLSAVNGLLLLIGRKDEGRAVLIFSASLWLVFLAVHAVRRRSERKRVARPEGQIRITPTAISAPSMAGEVVTLRWMDLSEARMTRDTEGNIFYELYSATANTSIDLHRSRVKDPETLDRELASRAPRFERTFEWEKTPTAAATLEAPSADLPPGEQFRLNLPATGWQTARGCGGLILALAAVLALALAFPDTAVRWLGSAFGSMMDFTFRRVTFPHSFPGAISATTPSSRPVEGTRGRISRSGPPQARGGSTA